MKVKKDMLIGEVVREYPETAEIMFKYGMHCVGCHMGSFETIEEGCKAHGMSDKDIDKMVEEINEKVEKTSESSFKISKEALAELRKEGKALRISSKDKKYEIKFVEKEEKDDVKLESKDIKVFIEKNSVKELKGKRLVFDGEFKIE